MDDWRLQGQESFLKGVELKKKTYKRYRKDWDHDHCEYCGSKFSEKDEDINKGYVTTDNYHWIFLIKFFNIGQTLQYGLVLDVSDGIHIIGFRLKTLPE